MEITKEMIDKVAMCKNAEDVIALAKTYGVDLTAEEAAKALKMIQSDELDEKFLDEINGGKRLSFKY